MMCILQRGRKWMGRGLVAESPGQVLLRSVDDGPLQGLLISLFWFLIFPRDMSWTILLLNDTHLLPPISLGTELAGACFEGHDSIWTQTRRGHQHCSSLAFLLQVRHKAMKPHRHHPPSNLDAPPTCCRSNVTGCKVWQAWEPPPVPLVPYLAPK